LENLTIDVWLDFASLPSYMAFTSLRRAVAAHPDGGALAIHPHPYFGGPVTTEESIKEAESTGIRLQSDLPSIDTYAAQRLIAGLDGNEAGADTTVVKVTEAIMRSYFELGLDIQNDETLIAIAQDFGLSGADARDALENPVAKEMVDQGFQIALHLGVQSAPFVLVGETLHLTEPTEAAITAALKHFQENNEF